jgi:hypothetical protein
LPGVGGGGGGGRAALTIPHPWRAGACCCLDASRIVHPMLHTDAIVPESDVSLTLQVNKNFRTVVLLQFQYRRS